MCRNLAEPGDAGVAERGVGVEAAGDSAGDERSALLGQQPEYSLLRRGQRIDPRRFAVEVVGDGALLAERMDMDRDARQIGCIDRGVTHANRTLLHFGQEARLAQRVLAVAGVEVIGSWTNDGKSSRYDEVLGRVSDLRNRLEVRSDRGDDYVAVANPPASATRGLFEPVGRELSELTRRVYVTDVDVLHLEIGARVLTERFVVDGGDVFELPLGGRNRGAHSVTSRSNRRISSSAFLSSASISSSGRGDVYL